MEELKDKEKQSEAETPPPIVLEGYVHICYDIDNEFAYLLPERMPIDEILNEPQVYECDEAGGIDLLSTLRKYLGKRVRIEIHVLE